jgi:hypothetical protein
MSGCSILAAPMGIGYDALRFRANNSKRIRIAVQAASAVKAIKRTVVSMANLQPDDSQFLKLGIISTK